MITQVRLSDLEDSVQLKTGVGEYITGCLCGHEFWRSPESWARAKQSLPSDVYSFAIASIYVMLNHTIFHLSDAELQGGMTWWHILRKHISHFSGVDGIQGLLEHLGPENPFFRARYCVGEGLYRRETQAAVCAMAPRGCGLPGSNHQDDQLGSQEEDNGKGGFATPVVSSHRVELTMSGVNGTQQGGVEEVVRRRVGVLYYELFRGNTAVGSRTGNIEMLGEHSGHEEAAVVSVAWRAGLRSP